MDFHNLLLTSNFALGQIGSRLGIVRYTREYRQNEEEGKPTHRRYELTIKERKCIFKKWQYRIW